MGGLSKKWSSEEKEVSELIVDGLCADRPRKSESGGNAEIEWEIESLIDPNKSVVTLKKAQRGSVHLGPNIGKAYRPGGDSIFRGSM